MSLTHPPEPPSRTGSRSGGRLEVYAADEQSAVAVDTLRWVRLADAVLAEIGVRGAAELSILFWDDESIAELNSRFLGREGPTDVLAFPIDDDLPSSGRAPDAGGRGPGFDPEDVDVPRMLGDIVICPQVAAENAASAGRPTDDELALLVVHGILHLLGMDHMDDREAEVMEARERELLARHYQALGAGEAAVPTETPDAPTPDAPTPD
ncbi:MAG: rRNA maturation RNase YbeY, partial [Acidimicrobiales bacterium]